MSRVAAHPSAPESLRYSRQQVQRTTVCAQKGLSSSIPRCTGCTSSLEERVRTRPGSAAPLACRSRGAPYAPCDASCALHTAGIYAFMPCRAMCP